MCVEIGIDLLYVKVNKVGGIESYIRNLLDGFNEYSENFHFILFLAKDNFESFSKYKNNKKFSLVKCNILSSNVAKRIIWENLFLNKLAERYNIDLMFIPVYSKPMYRTKLKYVTVIHDLAALHYPEYFSKTKYYWLKFAWGVSARTSFKLITITDFVKKDILLRYKNILEDKIEAIYNPIVIREISDFNSLSTMYNIDKNMYFYTVSSMSKHKNLITLLRMMRKIKENNLPITQKLVISGVGGEENQKIVNYITKNKLEDLIVLTGFVSDADRNSLYKNCSIFLFPTVFEGFGMPLIEAMMLGADVLCTRQEALVEITNNELIYVNNYYCVSEWIKKIKHVLLNSNRITNFDKYLLSSVTKKYLDVFQSSMR